MNVLKWLGEYEINFTLTNYILVIVYIILNILIFFRNYEATNGRIIKRWSNTRKALSLISAISWIVMLISQFLDINMNSKDIVYKVTFLIIIFSFIAKKINNYVEFKDVYIANYVRKID